MCSLFFVILRFRYITLIDLVTEGHNLEADVPLFFGSTCHAFRQKLCLQLQSRIYSLVYSETKVTGISETSVYIYEILRYRKPECCNSVTHR
jgi:hypothetical protein